MKKITQKWVNFAKRDLRDAEVLFKNKRYFGCIYHCHQSIEKFLKAIINKKEKKIRKTHDLPLLLKESEVRYPMDILEFIKELDPYYSPIRYPDIPESTSLKLRYQKARRILKLTKQTIKWLEFHLQ